MKKLFAVFVSVIMCLSLLASCGNKSKSEYEIYEENLPDILRDFVDAGWTVKEAYPDEENAERSEYWAEKSGIKDFKWEAVYLITKEIDGNDWVGLIEIYGTAEQAEHFNSESGPSLSTMYDTLTYGRILFCWAKGLNEFSHIAIPKGLVEHEHTLGEYLYDDTQHWRDLTCGHTTSVLKKSEHADKDYNGICDVCGHESELIYRTNFTNTAYQIVGIGPAFKGGDITIPSEYKGLPVEEICENAFVSDTCKITSVIIPDTIKAIGHSAFKNQNELESVTIGNGVETIDSWTFAGCSSLENVVLGNSITDIEHWAFEGCTKLKTLTVPATIKYIGDCFDDSGLTDIYLGISEPGFYFLDGWAEDLESKGVNVHWADAKK